MKALILAAGYATRLYPLTKDKPKPLLPVGGKTMLDRLIQKLEQTAEIEEVFVVTNEKFYGLFKDWNAALKTGMKVILDSDGSFSNEDRLGALGDIRLVIERRKICDDLIVLAGDNIFDWGLREFSSYLKDDPGSFAMGAYDIKDKEKTSRYGVIEVDDEGRIKNFLEKPPVSPTSLIATGIYYFPKDKLNLLSDYLKIGNEKDAPGHFIQWLYKKYGVRCHIFEGIWFDIGDIKSYHKADLAFSGGK
ncbi:MAG: nucleotidyltransferase family protein [Candidatus Omnitrophota bacterium]